MYPVYKGRNVQPASPFLSWKKKKKRKKLARFLPGESMEKYARAREIYGKLFPCLYYTVQTSASSLFRWMELLYKYKRKKVDRLADYYIMCNYTG